MGSDSAAPPQWENLSKWEGPAFASILAVLLGLCFQRPLEVFEGAFYWFIFTVFCGIYIDPLKYRSWKELFLYCTLPAAWLLATWAVLPALGIVMGGFRPSSGDKEFFLKFLVMGPIAFVFTTLAIPLSALGKGPILEILGVHPDKLDNVVRTLQKIGLIVSLLWTGVLYVKGLGSPR